MIGYYVHHVGRGHLHRALAVAGHLSESVTALSSMPVDERWPGPWLALARDDAGGPPQDATAGGQLHWAPRHDAGLQDRMAAIAGWIARHRPSVMVVDLSVEVIALARLMGVPTVAVTLPGIRDDAAHRLGFELADAIVAPWPARYRDLGPSLERYRAKVHHVGAISRYAGRSLGVPDAGVAGVPAPYRVLALSGTGDSPAGRPATGSEDPAVPGWHWQALGPGRWNADPWNEICAADVIVTHAGLGALADVAAARRPTVVIPRARPHDEQVTTAAVLAAGNLAVVADQEPDSPAQWHALLERAQQLGGGNWSHWSDGAGAARMAALVEAIAGASAC